MAAISGADVVVKTLIAAGVEHVFGIVSIHNMPIVESIARHDGISMISVRNEHSGTHMADGYARATGKLGVSLGSTGPGTTNTVTGLYEAQYASSKVLVVTGQAETGFYGKGKGYVHEAENQLPMLQTVARKVASPRYVDDVGADLAAVIDDINSARPQPGAIEIPIDLQNALTEVPLPTLAGRTAVPPAAGDIAAAVAKLKGANRRVILAGGGVIASGASAELKQLAELLDAPVITTPNGKGALPDDHPLLLGAVLQGGPSIAKALAEADVMLAVGTRFQAGVAGNSLKLPMPPLVHVDVDPRTIDLNYKADVSVVGDAGMALAQLADGLADAAGDAQFRDAMQTAATESKTFSRDRIGPDHAKIMDSIRAQLPRGGAFVRDNTLAGYYWGNALLPIYEPRCHMHPTSGAIGPGLPMAIGAAIGRGEKTVCVHGDGGFMYHIGELACAAQYEVPVVIIVYNDRGYGVLRGLQSNAYDGKFHDTELFTPNFVQMAESMGVTGYRAESADEFDEKLKAAMAVKGPSLIEIEVPNLIQMQGIVPAPAA